MPPPPPPSKSYLLVLDTDSEEEDDDDQPHYDSYNEELDDTLYETVEDESTEHNAALSVTPPRSAGSRRPHVVEDDEEDEGDIDTSYEDDTAAVAPTVSASAADKEHAIRVVKKDSDSSPTNGSLSATPPRKVTVSKNQKKNKKKRKKKKSKQESAAVDEEEEDQESYRTHVAFSNVSVRTYPRAFSEDAVPVDGGWPLGLSRDGYQDHDLIPLEDYETTKQEDLRERWHRIRDEEDAAVSLSPSAASSSNAPSSSKEHKPMNPEVVKLVNSSRSGGQDFPYLETRQWDYRAGVKNPLFGLMTEEKRQALFLEASTPYEERHNDSQGGSSSTNSISHLHKGRTRSNSVTSSAIPPSSSNSHHNRRPRSNSYGSHNSNGSHHSNNNQHQEQFNETYNQVYVHHVRNELEQLRIERNKPESTGCNCRKLTVYIPPKDGSGGKKAQHRRMKPGKLAQELKKRNIYDPSASREDMEKTLHDAVEKEPCCRDDGDCFCVRNGIDCQADTCSCWHDSHVHTKTRAGEPFLSTEEIKKRCGNPLGTYVVDLDAIDDFRRNLLQGSLFQRQLTEKDGDDQTMALFCQPCQPGSE